MVVIKRCPIEIAMKYMGKKWAVNIIRDIFLGKRRFRDFLEANPEISTKMLSARLKELEEHGVLEKKIVSKSPLTIEYDLTDKGRALKDVLYEMVAFSVNECPSEVFSGKEAKDKYLKEVRDIFS